MTLNHFLFLFPVSSFLSRLSLFHLAPFFIQIICRRSMFCFKSQKWLLLWRQFQPNLICTFKCLHNASIRIFYSPPTRRSIPLQILCQLFRFFLNATLLVEHSSVFIHIHTHTHTSSLFELILKIHNFRP
jgi:hypothetical protein